MGKYLLYTGILFSVLGLIACIFIFFYFDIKACFDAWRFIKKNEMGKIVKDHVSMKKKKRSAQKENEMQDTTNDMVEISDSENLHQEPTGSGLELIEKEQIGSVRFGEDIVKASFTEVLIDNDEEVDFLGKGSFHKKIDFSEETEMLEACSENRVVFSDETAVLYDEHHSDETEVLCDVLDLSGIEVNVDGS